MMEGQGIFRGSHLPSIVLFCPAGGSDVLTVSVWDKNHFSSDEFMGCGYVIIDNCMEGQVNKRVRT